MTDEMMIQMLANWNKLNHDLTKLREDQLKVLINYEASTRRSELFLKRLQQRYNKLRGAREFQEIMGGGLL